MSVVISSFVQFVKEFMLAKSRTTSVEATVENVGDDFLDLQSLERIRIGYG